MLKNYSKRIFILNVAVAFVFLLVCYYLFSSEEYEIESVFPYLALLYFAYLGLVSFASYALSRKK